ncbi:helix-turn-helix DNA binding domain protein [Gordonia phage JKSyngboy]|uniref:Helix-turn-helix DNA binding domain protein n=1 Tax=Gordonia phage JKSyngboy TaxID=2762400 RepID=A0A7G8LLD3_9CAUD|nr:DNA binding protein [Gordonia phage JKSyngboy]QNJ58055.1 helix-turn-helix DNA binding domain protein [Gordonia phage JKSyngboy]
MTEQPLNIAAFAKLAGISEGAMRKYHQRATQRRKEIAEGTTELPVADWMPPAPDIAVGRTPLWYPETAQKWVDSRPSRRPAASADA